MRTTETSLMPWSLYHMRRDLGLTGNCTASRWSRAKMLERRNGCELVGLFSSFALYLFRLVVDLLSNNIHALAINVKTISILLDSSNFRNTRTYQILLNIRWQPPMNFITLHCKAHLPRRNLQALIILIQMQTFSVLTYWP
jgi:hypothetical protein